MIALIKCHDAPEHSEQYKQSYAKKLASLPFSNCRLTDLSARKLLSLESTVPTVREDEEIWFDVIQRPLKHESIDEENPP